MGEKKRLADLNLTDRFLFDETMEYKEAYEALVSILLEEDVRFEKGPETEKELRVSPQLREVRLDVVAMDESEKLYYTEMQKNNTGNLIRRSRYYQAQVDVSLLEPGERNFNKLNSTCMVLIAPFDLFGKGLYRYTFEGVCRECPELKLDDGALRVFINTHGKNDEDFSGEFLELMKYLENSTDEMSDSATSKRVKLIHSSVTKVKLSEKMGVKYMQWWEELAEAKDEGLEQGLKQGLEQGLKQGLKQGRSEGELHKLLKQIIAKIKKNQTPEIIAEALEEDVEYIRSICRIVQEFAPEYDCEEIIEKVNKESKSQH